MRYGSNPGDYDDDTILMGEPKPEVVPWETCDQLYPRLSDWYLYLVERPHDVPQEILETKRMVMKRQHQIWWQAWERS